MGLTTSQRAAVSYDGNLIIFAGPGSGKTSTSVAKGMRILQTRGHVLCMLTFSTAAAKEMRHRMATAAGSQADTLLRNRLIVGTFNALTLKHYQQYCRKARRLLAPPARALLLHNMMRSFNQEEREATIAALDKYQAKVNPDTCDMEDDHVRFVQAYEAKLQASHAIDLASIMREVTLGIADGTMPPFSITHLLGDEMQDADEVQHEFMLVHARRGVMTTLVADDDQTIYGWRSALGYEGLTRFAEDAKAKTIVLAENFRSREEVVAHATKLIAHNDPERIPKNQRPTRGPGGVLAYVSFGALSDECQAVARAIERFRGEGESVAVLARTNAALIQMQSWLIKRQVPFRRDGPSVWEHRAVVAYMALLQALTRATTPDLMTFLQQGPLDVPLVTELTHLLGPQCGGFLDGDVPSLSRATPSDVKELEHVVEATTKWRRGLQRGSFDVVIMESAAFALAWLDRGGMTDTPEGKQMHAVMETASNALAELRGKLSARLAAIQALQAGSAKPGAVQLMTKHSSKGLEFDTVFLIDAVPPSGGGSEEIDMRAERRLFYVALTRAKERFIATFSKTGTPFIGEAELPYSLSVAAVFGSAAPDLLSAEQDGDDRRELAPSLSAAA